VKVAFDFEN